MMDSPLGKRSKVIISKNSFDSLTEVSLNQLNDINKLIQGFILDVTNSLLVIIKDMCINGVTKNGINKLSSLVTGIIYEKLQNYAILYNKDDVKLDFDRIISCLFTGCNQKVGDYITKNIKEVAKTYEGKENFVLKGFKQVDDNMMMASLQYEGKYEFELHFVFDSNISSSKTYASSCVRICDLLPLENESDACYWLEWMPTISEAKERAYGYLENKQKNYQEYSSLVNALSSSHLSEPSLTTLDDDDKEMLASISNNHNNININISNNNNNNNNYISKYSQIDDQKLEALEDNDDLYYWNSYDNCDDEYDMGNCNNSLKNQSFAFHIEDKYAYKNGVAHEEIPLYDRKVLGLIKNPSNGKLYKEADILSQMKVKIKELIDDAKKTGISSEDVKRMFNDSLLEVY